MAQLRRVSSGRAEDAEHRSNVLRKIRAQSMEFSELSVEYGYGYASAAVVADASPPPEPIDDIRVNARPHARARRCRTRGSTTRDGNRYAIKDLAKPGRSLLIVGEDGEAWCVAARQFAGEAGLPLGALRIGQCRS